MHKTGNFSSANYGILSPAMTIRRKLIFNGYSTASFIIWQKLWTTGRHYRRLRCKV